MFSSSKILQLIHIEHTYIFPYSLSHVTNVKLWKNWSLNKVFAKGESVSQSSDPGEPGGGRTFLPEQPVFHGFPPTDRQIYF